MTNFEPSASAGASTASATGLRYAEGSIAARIDRLPLGATRWKLVMMGQLLWGCVVGLDAVVLHGD